MSAPNQQVPDSFVVMIPNDFDQANYDMCKAYKVGRFAVLVSILMLRARGAINGTDNINTGVANATLATKPGTRPAQHATATTHAKQGNSPRS